MKTSQSKSHVHHHFKLLVRKVSCNMLFSLISCCIAATVIAADENYRSGYLIIRENKYFAGQVAKQTNSPSLMSCVQECLRHPWCTSINFKEAFLEKRSSGNCELNKHDFSAINFDSGKLTQQLGTTFTMFLKVRRSKTLPWSMCKKTVTFSLRPLGLVTKIA